MKKFILATIALVAVVPAAISADLGSPGVADLEERVAELEATTARKGNRKMALTVYGSVNEAILWVDDGNESRRTVTNNGNAQTRFGFMGEAKFGSGLTAGYLLEVGTAKANYTGSAEYALGIRHSALYIKSDSLGTVWLGKTSTATDGVAEIDLTNASIASTRLSLEPLSPSYLMGAHLPFDGNREEVLKYVSPSIAGFVASASWYSNRNDAWDASLRYAGEFGGQFRIGAGIGYRVEDDLASAGSKSKTFNGSVSMLHIQSGLFLNGSYGDMTGATASTTIPLADIRAWHVQGGVERKIFDIGPTTMFGEYARLEAKSGGGSTDMWGLGAVQEISPAAMHLYMNYRDYQDFGTRTLTAGAVIKF